MNDLREQVFKKMGWKQTEYQPKHSKKTVFIGLWKNKNVTEQLYKLPPIETSWEVCAQYLVPFMRGKGWDYEVLLYVEDPKSHRASDNSVFLWEFIDGFNFEDAEIINDNIALAACEAFMEVEL